MNASLCCQYLSERGITDDTIKLYGLDLHDRLSQKIAKDRLGRTLPHGYTECIWIPIHDDSGNVISWIARPLPTIPSEPKFVCPLGSHNLAFIPQSVYKLACGKELIFTEAAIKALAVQQAGFDCVGINGVWGASLKNSKDLYVITAQLQQALEWGGRKVCLAFDADCDINPKVRQALFRLYFVLTVAGAKVCRLDWPLAEGKGIDDYLVHQLAGNGQCSPQDRLQALIASAHPFNETVTDTALDLDIVCTELQKVLIPGLLRRQICKSLATPLGVKPDDLLKIGPQKPSDFVDPVPWPDPVEGNNLLTDLVSLIKKHIVTEEACKAAVALWVILSYLIEQVDIMPLLAIISPEKRCGKTRFLTLLLKLVRRPIPGVSLTAATVYRAIEKWHPTLLVDEADGVLKDSKGHDNLELKCVINSGHTRELAYVNRCVGDAHDVQRFSTWAPKAIALIGRMPDSMMDRSIVIPLKRKTKTETVARIRETPEQVFEELRSKIVRFVEDNGSQIGQLIPPLPPGLNDRAEDCWLPMLAIADTIGGSWPADVRKVSLELSKDSEDADTFATKLFRALKEDFEGEGEDHDQGFQFSGDICSHLSADNEAPWASFPRQLTPELLARNLGRYKVKSERNVVGGTRGRGYYWKKLKPVFDRYL